MKSKMIYEVSVEFESAEDAYALAQIIAELGIEARIASRSIANASRNPISGTRLGSLILSAMTQNQLYRASDFEEVVEARGYKANSISPVLSYLAREGVIESAGAGLYKLV